MLIIFGGNKVKIAVPYDNENIFQHFEYTECFKIYDIENNEINSTEIISTMGKKEHSDLTGMLAMIEVDAVICENIDDNVQTLLEDEGITLYSGCTGNADKAINSLIFGDMVFENL